MGFGRKKDVPSKAQIDAYVAEQISKAEVVRKLRDETSEGRTDLLRKLMAYSGPVSEEDIKKAAHQTRWKVYWDLKDLHELDITTEQEVAEAWLNCERYYGETSASTARQSVDRMISQGTHPTLARAAASEDL